MPPRFDHLVVGASELESGIAAFAHLSGVGAVAGGRHPGRGTENALVSLGRDAYLELLSPQPGAIASGADASLSSLRGLTLIDWAVAVDDVEELGRQLADAGLEVDGPRPGARTTPAGIALAWRTLRLRAGLFGAPFFIEWHAATVHPSRSLPSGCALTALTIESPDAARLMTALATSDLPMVAVRNGPGSMRADLTGASDQSFSISCRLGSDRGQTWGQTGVKP